MIKQALIIRLIRHVLPFVQTGIIEKAHNEAGEGFAATSKGRMFEKPRLIAFSYFLAPSIDNSQTHRKWASGWIICSIFLRERDLSSPSFHRTETMCSSSFLPSPFSFPVSLIFCLLLFLSFLLCPRWYMATYTNAQGCTENVRWLLRPLMLL